MNNYPPEHIRQEMDNLSKKVRETLKGYDKVSLTKLLRIGKDYHRYIYCQWLHKRGMPYGLAYFISKWKSYSKVPSMGMMLGELEDE